MDLSLRQAELDLQELLRVHERLDDTLTTGTDFETMATAREMNTGRGSDQVVKELTSRPLQEVDFPVYNANCGKWELLPKIRDFFGSVGRASEQPSSSATDKRKGSRPTSAHYNTESRLGGETQRDMGMMGALHQFVDPSRQTQHIPFPNSKRHPEDKLSRQPSLRKTWKDDDED
jgi:hypothetical protein